MNNKKTRLNSPELQYAIKENEVIRDNDSDMSLEIRNRIYDQLNKQKRIDCFDACITLPLKGKKISGDMEDFMVSFEYKNKTVLLQGYVVDAIKECA